MSAPLFDYDFVDRGAKGPGDYNNYSASFHELRPLTDSEIKYAIESEINDSLGELGSQVAEDRRRALMFYYGRPFGNEVSGRSNVVMTHVADTIEWILPSLIRMFVGSGRIWLFSAMRPGQEAAAEQATMAVNHLFLNTMGGFMILWDWFKTALLEKNGFVHPRFEEVFEPKVQTYRGLTDAEVGMVMENPNVEITAMRPHEGENIVNIATGEEYITYDITTVQTKVRGRFVCDGIPPEEFLIARRALRLDQNTQFSAHRRKMTVSHLISLGFDPNIVVNLRSDDTPEWSQGRTERYSLDESWPTRTAERSDAASREIWVTHAYIRLDEDGDGYSELRQVLVVGESSITLLDDRPANFMPFCSITPNPMPHKFFGLSIADQVMDLQVIGSTIVRQILDGTYLANNPRYLVDDGADVDIDSLLASVPGGVVLTDNIEAVRPLETQQIPQQTFQLLDYLEGVLEKRTGVTKWMQGPDASSLKDSALGSVTEAMRAAGQKIETIARIFAETGVKDLGRNLLRLMIENAARPQVMRINGDWIEINPSTWSEDMDLSVETGLGQGQAAAQIQNLGLIADRQKQLLEQPMTQMMVTPRNVYNLAQAFTETLGLPLKDQFFTNPDDQPWPQQPEAMADQVRMKESDRRAKEDDSQAQIKGVQLALDSSIADQLQAYRAAQIDSEERMRILTLESQERIARIQMEASTNRSQHDES